MALPKSGIVIPRQSIVGSEALFVKMFDPPMLAPPTPELLDLQNLPPGVNANPVPEVMAAAGYLNLGTPHTHKRDLLHGDMIPTWDGAKELMFFTITDPELRNGFSGPHFPGPIVHIPRGAIFHCFTDAKGPPPHTIHWHGQEPTPMNDGVGHCSFEIKGGGYTYQLQPNFIGTYFYHCHRNTVQHFEFGLYSLFIVEPPDAYFASIASTNPDGTVNLNGIPIGHCSDGMRRTAAMLDAFPQFGGYVGGNLAEPDFGINAANPHAFTVPYDIEAIWGPDDRDSVWSDMASNAFQTFPKHGSVPGENDDFHANVSGGDKFFAFNDFNPDYWFVSGVPVPAPRFGTGTIPAGIVLPPELNSGISGTQVSVEANVGQTVFIRCLIGSYDRARVTLPVDAVIVEWDGRALGVPPFGLYNAPYLVPAGTPIPMSVARRFGALVKCVAPNSTPAKVEFIRARGGDVVNTALIPFNIT